MIFTIGSINLDHVYNVDHMPMAGETLAAQGYARFLGGKGVNQSIAAHRAGADVRHIGAIADDDEWVAGQIQSFGLDMGGIARLPDPTGHAIINVDATGENQIVIFGGANQAITQDHVQEQLSNAPAGSWVLFQNETNDVIKHAKLAKSMGCKICYSAAPFVPDDALPMLEVADLIAVNEDEAKALSSAKGVGVDALGAPMSLVTKGSKGALLIVDGTAIEQAAFSVTPVDTTGAGDTFLGSFIGRLDQGEDHGAALKYASAASALQVTRQGAAPAIPTEIEVLTLLEKGNP